MKKPNKFEVAAELDTEEKRGDYLLEITALDINIKELTDHIDTVNLAAECHPKEFLLSEKWQKGYECNNLKVQKTINIILESILCAANTTLDSAAKLSIGGDIVNELSMNSLISESSRESLLSRLVTSADKHQADAFCMYDPEVHPDLGEAVKNGKEKLFIWTDKHMEKLLK